MTHMSVYILYGFKHICVHVHVCVCMCACARVHLVSAAPPCGGLCGAVCCLVEQCHGFLAGPLRVCVSACTRACDCVCVVHVVLRVANLALCVVNLACVAHVALCVVNLALRVVHVVCVVNYWRCVAHVARCVVHVALRVVHVVLRVAHVCTPCCLPLCDWLPICD